MTEVNLSLPIYLLRHLVYPYLAPLALLTTLGGVLIGQVNLRWARLDSAVRIAVDANFVLIAVLSLGYLLYPGYLDHVEPTVAGLGEVFRQGGQIYPALNDFSMHGLLYGPALSEIDALFLSCGLPIVLASKLPGVLALLVSLLLLHKLFRGGLARWYLVFLMPFGFYLFWNRAEPLFLLLVTLPLAWCARANSTAFALLAGCLAGVATCLKLHGVLYVAAAVLVIWQDQTFQWRRLSAFGVGTIGTALLAFAPDQISCSGFLIYLGLAGKHGVAGMMLVKNGFYLLVLAAPILYLILYRIRSGLLKNKRQLLVPALLLGLELVVAIIGSKPGAGPHHLLPFIPVNAYLILRMLEENPQMVLPIDPFRFGILALALGSLCLLAIPARQMIAQYPLQLEMHSEIAALLDRYPGMVMGVSDDQHYPATFFKPLLEARGVAQFDYAAYMDLNFSGVGDDVFVAALRACRIPYLVLPSAGEPFALNSLYRHQALLSPGLRAAFAGNYAPLADTAHYRVYGCRSAQSRMATP